MSPFRRVLVLAADDEMRQLIVEELQRSGHDPVPAESLDQAVREISGIQPDIVVIHGKASVLAIQSLLDKTSARTAFILCESLGADAVVPARGHEVRSLSTPYRMDDLLSVVASLESLSLTD